MNDVPLKKYEALDWDSKFFKFKVGRITENNLNLNELKSLLFSLKAENFSLIYYSSTNPIEQFYELSMFYEMKLVDKKVTYIKKTRNRLPYNNLIKSYEKDYPEDKLITLAIESGIYSRFNLDQQIQHYKFEELYKLWIIGSVQKQIADEVLVYKENDEIIGFVTLGEKKNRADIGIAAVDSSHRGKGIGKLLMYAAESWALKKSYELLQVITQFENIPACKLYEGSGFKVEKIEYFYHIWDKEKV